MSRVPKRKHSAGAVPLSVNPFPVENIRYSDVSALTPEQLFQRILAACPTVPLVGKMPAELQLLFFGLEFLQQRSLGNLGVKDLTLLSPAARKILRELIDPSSVRLSAPTPKALASLIASWKTVQVEDDAPARAGDHTLLGVNPVACSGSSATESFERLCIKVGRPVTSDAGEMTSLAIYYKDNFSLGLDIKQLDRIALQKFVAACLWITSVSTSGESELRSAIAGVGFAEFDYLAKLFGVSTDSDRAKSVRVLVKRLWNSLSQSPSGSLHKSVALTSRANVGPAVQALSRRLDMNQSVPELSAQQISIPSISVGCGYSRRKACVGLHEDFCILHSR